MKDMKVRRNRKECTSRSATCDVVRARMARAIVYDNVGGAVDGGRINSGSGADRSISVKVVRTRASSAGTGTVVAVFAPETGADPEAQPRQRQRWAPWAG